MVAPTALVKAKAQGWCWALDLTRTHGAPQVWCARMNRAKTPTRPSRVRLKANMRPDKRRAAVRAMSFSIGVARERAPKTSHVEREYRDRHRFGFDMEDAVIVAFAGDFEPPKWFRGVRPGTEKDDHAGVDLWVDTDRGPVAVQIKTSGARAKEFAVRHKGEPIAIVIVHPAIDDEGIRARVLLAVEGLMLKSGAAA